MTLKAGTVCYIVGTDAPEANGHVVTLTGETGFSESGNRALVFRPSVWTRYGPADAAEPPYLLPISDPDQPVGVTSDTDEPVTA